jgi:hypothetical protein
MRLGNKVGGVDRMAVMAETSAAPLREAGSISRWAAALRQVRSPHFSPYKLYIRRDLRLAVMLNPKVGSTMFRTLVVEGMREAGMAPALGPLWPIRRTRRYMTAPPRDFLHLLLRPECYRLHCFVRNPYARLLSAWKDKFTLTSSGDPAARSMKRELQTVRRFAARCGLPGAEAGSAVPLGTFVAYVESQAEGRRNQHWDTQVSVLGCGTRTYDHIWRMETDFAAGMTSILTQVGLSRSWLEDRLSRPRNASRRLAEPVYNARLAARVWRIYRADFQQFGYAADSWESL